MSGGEFGLIARLVGRLPVRRADVLAGPGDDAAVLRAPAGMDLVQTVDACIAGVHFPADLPAADVGWRCLAVNLSDLAAMGAEPAWALLSLAMPAEDEAWLDGFADGFGELARATGTDLVGGDTVRGELAVVITLTGFVPAGAALSRHGARAGDGIWVTGPLGAGAAGLAAWREGRAEDAQRFRRPAPRLAEGRSLRSIASAAIDVSDGLAADLGHVLAASGVGAVLAADALPLAAGGEEGLRLALHGGDDYELCFTVPSSREAALRDASRSWPAPPIRIGSIRAEPGLWLEGGPSPGAVTIRGYDHFAGGAA